MTFRLTKGQEEALRKAVSWYYSLDYSKKSMFVIGGYAGCGKSTIVKTLTEILNLDNNSVLYSAYTGKAVNVLRIKGNNARTVHKTFYNIYRGSKGGFSFKLKSSLPMNIELIVLDELSMLNDKFINDILSFGYPVIGLGDPGQLEPIFGENSFIKLENIDILLTEIMRQDDSSGIIDLSFMARNNQNIPYGQYKASKVIKYSEISNIEEYDIVLCYKNSTRRALNRVLRNRFGYKSILPLKNEKLICLKNNYFHELDYENMSIIPVNGLCCIALEDSYVKEDESICFIKYKPEFIDNNDVFFDTKCEKLYFDMYGLTDLVTEFPFINRGEESDEIVHLDFGYALTVHKSQGSEWDNVLLIDEYQGPQESYNKWLYTGITRAKKSITIAKGG